MLPAANLRHRLLAWYDANARALPWRVGPADHARGVRQDPYKVWLSEVMLQQTTVPHATPYFLAFTRRWPRVTDLAREADGEVMSAWAERRPQARATFSIWARTSAAPAPEDSSTSPMRRARSRTAYRSACSSSWTWSAAPPLASWTTAPSASPSWKSCSSMPSKP